MAHSGLCVLYDLMATFVILRSCTYLQTHKTTHMMVAAVCIHVSQE